MSEDYDIVLIGNGLVGACAGALLVRKAGIDPARIALLGRAAPPVPASGAAPEVRVAAVSRASERVLRAAGGWQRLDAARLTPYERMCVWHESVPPRSEGMLCFDAADLGEPDLGAIAELSALTQACLESFVAAGGIQIAGELEQLELTEDAAFVSSGGVKLRSRLVVGADGAHSEVRARSGLSARVRDYRQVALVANIATQRPHEHTAWQRFLRTGPLALLPLFDGTSSIVWSADEPYAQRLLECPDEEFEARLTVASDAVLGAARLASARVSFPLRSVRADGYVTTRCALIGDAAHVIHPLAGQGANLGLLDAAALCESIASAVTEGEDIGALRPLRRYEQQRRTHNLATDAAMTAFRSGFALSRGPLPRLLSSGLAAVNRNDWLKRILARQALGVSGELPQLARAQRSGI
jgi:2-octaprenylphenol hydroxylase